MTVLLYFYTDYLSDSGKLKNIRYHISFSFITHLLHLIHLILIKVKSKRPSVQEKKLPNRYLWRFHSFLLIYIFISLWWWYIFFITKIFIKISTSTFLLLDILVCNNFKWSEKIVRKIFFVERKIWESLDQTPKEKKNNYKTVRLMLSNK